MCTFTILISSEKLFSFMITPKLILLVIFSSDVSWEDAQLAFAAFVGF